MPTSQRHGLGMGSFTTDIAGVLGRYLIAEIDPAWIRHILPNLVKTPQPRQGPRILGSTGSLALPVLKGGEETPQAQWSSTLEEGLVELRAEREAEEDQHTLLRRHWILTHRTMTWTFWDVATHTHTVHTHTQRKKKKSSKATVRDLGVGR